MKDYYAILEVPPTASPEAIREQYLFLIQAWHPDKFRTPAQKAKAEEKSKEINIAYAVLKDAQKRAKYDREIKGQPARRGEEARREQAEEQRQHKQAEEAQRRQREQQRRQQAEETQRRESREQRPKSGPTDEERMRAEHERQAWVEQEWIRVYFEQARRRQEQQPPAGAPRQSQKPIRVLIVEDAADTRGQIRNLLRGEADIQVVGEAPNGRDAVRQFEALMPDVMITGINRPDLDSFVATETIRRKYPTSRVIMLSVPSSIDNIRRAAMVGVCDYLTKPARGDELRSAIRLAVGRRV